MGSAVTAATAVTWIFALLLAAAGGDKLARPAGTSRVLTHALGAGRSGSATTVRVLGAGELCLAAAVLTLGGPLAAGLQGAAYLVFAGFALRQLSAGADCGCFGAGTPATGVHVAVDATAVLAAATAATGAAPGPAAVLPAPGWPPDPSGLASWGVVAGAVAVAAALLRLALTGLAGLRDARGAGVAGGGR